MEGNEEDISKRIKKKKNDLLYNLDLRKLEKEINEAIETDSNDEILEVLGESFRQIKSNDKSYIIKNIRKSGNNKYLPFLLRLLEIETILTQEEILETIGKIGDSSVVPSLIEILNRGITRSVWIIKTLGELQDSRSIPILLDNLYDNKDKARIEVIDALGSIGISEPIDQLIDLLKDEDEAIKIRTIKSIGKISDSRTIPYLIEMLDDTSDEVREATVLALGNFSDSKVIEALINAYKDKNPHVRSNVVEILGELKTKKALNIFIQALNEEMSFIHLNAVKALGELDEPKATHSLINRIVDADGEINFHIVRTLIKKMNKNLTSIDYFLSLLKDESWEIRRNVIILLSFLDTYDSKNILREMLKDQNSDVQKEAERVLGKLGDKEILEPYIKDLSSKDGNIRKKAVKFLSKTSNPEVVKPLIESASKEEIKMKELILNAIMEIFNDYFSYEIQDKYNVKESSDLIKLLFLFEWGLSDEIAWKILEIVGKFDFRKSLQSYIKELFKEGKFKDDTARNLIYKLFEKCYRIGEFFFQEDLCLAILDAIEINDETVQEELFEVIKEVECYSFYRPYLDLFEKSNDFLKIHIASILQRMYRENQTNFDIYDCIEVIWVLQEHLEHNNPEVRRAVIIAISAWLDYFDRLELLDYQFEDTGIDIVKLKNIYEEEKSDSGKAICKKCNEEVYAIKIFCDRCNIEL
ncbi:MAG: HEAT repeat domain-containing protein [Asgard group archaeon]|nr:HEAT repeat domain-containing protein [Asgard group archaeon]